MIAIAHPKFREQLMAKAKECKYLFEDQVIPEGAVYPVEVEHEREFGGLRLFIRPVKPSDERLMQEHLYHLSERSVYLRFFQNVTEFGREITRDMVAVDYKERFGIVATIGAADAERIVASAHWRLDVDENMAEVTTSVADEFQQRGLGQYMSHLLLRLARERGIKGFRAYTLVENEATRRIFEREARESDSALHTIYDAGLIRMWFRFGEKAEDAPPSTCSDPLLRSG